MFLVSKVAKFFTIKLSKVMSASTPDSLKNISYKVKAKFTNFMLIKFLKKIGISD